MDNICKFPGRAVIEEEAAAWLIKLDGDDPLTAKEHEALQEWVGRSPRHLEALKDLAEFWDQMNVLTELAVPLGRSDSQADIHHKKNSNHFDFRFSSAGMVAAAGVVGIALALSLWMVMLFSETNGFYTTAVGQQKTVSMSDGSVFELNTNSQVEVEYSKGHRNVRLLQGEVHFTVAKDSARPFRVYAGNSRVQAVGTAFSVYLQEDALDVIVTEGRVKLAALKQDAPANKSASNSASNRISNGSALEKSDQDNQQVIDLGELDAGQGAIISKVKNGGSVAQNTEEQLEKINEQELMQRLSWREGLLIFSGEPLSAVVEKISRYTPLSITIVDPEVSAIKIGGQIRLGETEAMLNALQVNFGLRVTRLGYNEVQLSAK